MSLRGYAGGAWGPRVAPTAPPRPPSVISVARNGVVTSQATNIPYYDSSRIIKDIKVVKDMRQSGTERGETQTGDDGFLGPGSGGRVAPPSAGTPVAVDVKNKWLVPAALVAAFFLFGG